MVYWKRKNSEQFSNFLQEVGLSVRIMSVENDKLFHIYTFF